MGAARPAHRLLFAEMAQLPLQYYMANQVVGFWNRVQKQAGSLALAVLRQEIHDALADPAGSGWGAAVLRLLTYLDIDIWSGLPQDVIGFDNRVDWLLSKPLLEGTIVTALRERLMSGWEHVRLGISPEVYPSDGKQPGIQMAKYKHWMGMPIRAGSGNHVASACECLHPALGSLQTYAVSVVLLGGCGQQITCGQSSCPQD